MTARAIVSACIGLVELRTETGTFGFSHAAVKECLDDNKGYLDDNKNDNLSDFDQDIRKFCVLYLSAVDKLSENRDGRPFYDGLFPHASRYRHEHINNDDDKTLLNRCRSILERCQSDAWRYWLGHRYIMSDRPGSELEVVCRLRNRLIFKTLLSDINVDSDGELDL